MGKLTVKGRGTGKQAMREGEMEREGRDVAGGGEVQHLRQKHRNLIRKKSTREQKKMTEKRRDLTCITLGRGGRGKWAMRGGGLPHQRSKKSNYNVKKTDL